MDESLMVSRVEGMLGRALTPEESYEIEMWDRGRTLSQVVNTEAWTILTDTIKSYVDQATEALTDLPPGDEKVKEAHAAASALKDFHRKFQEDVKRAIESSMQTPKILKVAARFTSAVPPESM